MSRVCPFCERETDDLVGGGDVVMCRRCAEGVDVRQALRAAGASTEVRPARPASPPPPRPAGRFRRRHAVLAAAGAAALLAGIAIGRAGCEGYRYRRELDLLLREAEGLEAGRPGQARARYAEILRFDPGNGRAREGLDRAEARLGSLERALGIVDEVRKRMGRLEGGFDREIEEIAACEGLLGKALEAEPGLAEAHLWLGKVHAARGRSDRAHEAFDRALELDAENLEALASKGGALVTARLMLLLDREVFPGVAEALRQRAARKEGDAFEEILGRLPGEGSPALLARLFRDVARSEWEGARRALEDLKAAGTPAPVRDDLPALPLAVAYLAGGRHPGLVALTALVPPAGAERDLWMAILRELERKPGTQRPIPPAGGPSSVHPAALRLEAAHANPSEAASILARAVSSCPEDLPARMARARLLAGRGDRAGAGKEAEAAARLAEAMGLPEAARREIAGLIPSNP